MAAKAGKLVWTGRILTILISALFVMSAVMKLLVVDDVKKGMDKMGFKESLILPLGILELSCVIVYLIPQTTIIGAILLTGYLGGAIVTHVRADEPIYSHVVIGIIIWLGPFLRDERLRVLIPWRRLPSTPGPSAS